MKNLRIIFALMATILVWGCQKSSVNDHQVVNSLLGDKSFEEKFGFSPDASTDEQLRLTTHLSYVEDLLRSKDVSHLAEELQTRREQMLDYLHTYWTAGLFPKNYDFVDQRKPCFIDKDGAICAVGYLIEQTAGREIAEYINSRYQYEELLVMNDENIDQWIAASGLTKEECAMIQPAYGPPTVTTYNHIPVGYGITSSLVGGMNLALNTVNGVQIGKGAKSKTAPALGLASGVGQVVLGIAKMPEKTDNSGMSAYAINESQKTLSMVNIGLGTTTMILSAWNLITNRTPKQKLTTWNVHTFPTQNNTTGMAVSLKRKF